MDGTGGALHFDADLDNRKFILNINTAEQRAELFAINVIKSAGKIDEVFAKLADSLGGGGKFTNGINSAQGKVRDFQDTIIQGNRIAGNSFGLLGGNMANGKFNNGIASMRTNFSQLGREAVNGTNEANEAINRLGNNTQNEANKMSGIFSGLTGVIAGFLSIQAAEGFATKIIDIRTEFENLDVAFTTILKSKEKADTLMSEIVDFAATTPFGLTEVAKSTKQLLAYGVAATDVKDELTTLGNIAAGVSQPIGEIAYLYGTLKTQGRAYAMDIRQFTGRGIPIVAELAKQFGVTAAEVMNLVEQGKVGFPEVQTAFQNMTGAGGAFFDLMQKQSLTTGGRISNLKDQIDLMFNSFGESSTGLINSGISGLQFMVDNYKSVIDIITLLIATYGTYRAALAVTAAVNKLNADATAARVLALNAELEAEINGVAVKQQVILQSSALAGATLTEAQAKAVNANATMILGAQETASITRKAALAASSAFYTAKLELEAAGRAGASAATIAEMQANLALLATKKAEATAAAVAARNELLMIEQRTVNSAVTVNLTASETLRTIGLGIAAKAQAVYNSVLAAAPMAAAVLGAVALGAAIYALTQANNTASEAAQRFNDISADATIKTTEAATKVEDYVKIAKDQNSTLAEKEKAIKKLNALNPEFLGGLNAANIATAEGSKIIQQYLTDLNNKALGELAYTEKLANQRKILELETKGADAIDNFERLGSGLKGFVTTVGFGTAKEMEEYLVKNKVDALKAANAKIDQKYAPLIKKYQLNGLDETTAPPVPGNGKRTEAVIKNEIKKYEDLKAAEDIHSAAYGRYVKKIEALNQELSNSKGKLTSSQNKEKSDRLKALEAIDKAETKAKQRSLSTDEEKLQKAKDEAEALRKLAQKGNLGAGSMARIDAVEQTTTGAIKYEIDTEKLLKEINTQKDIFKKYEEYKIDVSADAANTRFANEKKDFDTFSEYLQSQIQPIYDKLKDKGEITGKEQERLTKLLEIQKGYNSEVTDEENKKFAESYNAALTYEEEVKRIKQQYADYATRLGKSATNSRKESLLQERDDAINAAKDEALKKTKIYRDLAQETLLYTQEQVKAQIAELKKLIASGSIPAEFLPRLESQLGNLEMKLKIGIDQGNLEALKADYNKTLALLNSKDSEGKQSIISDEEYKRIIAALNEIQRKIKEIDGTGDGKVSYADKLAANFKYLKGNSKEVAEGVSNDLGRISGGFNELSEAFGGADTEAGYFMGTLGELAQVGSDAAGSFAAFASGDIIGGITKAISAVAGLFSIGKKVKEMNEKARQEVAAFYENARLGELEYQQLLRDRERKLLEINAINTKGIQDQTKALQAQSAEINKSYQETLKRLQAEQKIISVEYTHGTWFRKAKTEYQYGSLSGVTDYDEFEKLYTSGALTDGAKALFEELKRLKTEGADVEEALKAAAVAAAELATGTTAANLSSQIIESLKAGKSGLTDVMDDYTKIIQDALLSTFKSDVVDVEMKAFYDRLAKLAESGGELSQDEIEQAKLDYLATRERIKKAFEAQQAITGIDLTDGSQSDKNGITASVQSLSENTGVVIEGLMRGIYDIIKRNGANSTQNSINLAQQINLMNQMIGLQTQTATNTAQIAVNTEGQLVRIDTMIKNLETIANNTVPPKSGRDLGII